MNKTNKKYIVVKDRVKIYKDFTFNLLYYIQKYYVDRESLSEDEDIHNHFMWCYDKASNDFKNEEIDFSTNDTLKKYFYNYYYHQFYTLDDEKYGHDGSLKYFEEFWDNIFEIDNQKNKNVIGVLIELYTIFDTSIKSEKNILEMI